MSEQLEHLSKLLELFKLLESIDWIYGVTNIILID